MFLRILFFSIRGLLLVIDEIQPLTAVEREAGVAEQSLYVGMNQVAVTYQIDVDTGVEKVSHSSNIGSFIHTSP